MKPWNNFCPTFVLLSEDTRQPEDTFYFCILPRLLRLRQRSRLTIRERCLEGRSNEPLVCGAESVHEASPEACEDRKRIDSRPRGKRVRTEKE
ncbi:hypothetical protein NDU88_006370 [Pleurodeles waltl]|uniref:Uncharacterized protein n=1 Tax=Pleurodeles waltl TaxID=8319 RepID=A0AAV7TEX3_PLEWA|nr:hypothetical protein NDU88_006370 [Pleurodeles waltl]